MRARLLAILFAAALALVAACGGSSETTPETTEPAQSRADLTIVMREFTFSPAEVTMASGTEVEFQNAGTIEHNWTALTEPIEAVEQLRPELVAFVVDLQPGASEVRTVDLAPGTYQVICTIPGHFAAGMVGTATITG